MSPCLVMYKHDVTVLFKPKEVWKHYSVLLFVVFSDDLWSFLRARGNAENLSGKSVQSVCGCIDNKSP